MRVPTKAFFVTFVFAVLSGELVTDASQESVQTKLILAKKGKTQLPIVISEKASENTRKSARELASFLGRISGATFEVNAGDGTSGIVVGTHSDFPHPELAKPLEIKNGFDGKEAFVIRTEPNRLLLIGATDLGVSHAVYRLLEHLGCRWFFAAPEWEVVPNRPDLTVSLNESDRPALLSRRIWYGYGYFDRGRCLEDYQNWARRNRMAASFSIHAGHAWQTIILDNKKIFADHPEYLALVKGKRQGEQLCVSNPEVRAIATKWALGRLAKNPALDMVSMETSDGAGHCECEACKKLGSISDRAFGLANEVARAVAREYPGKMVGMLAYSEHSEPPSFPLEPNVYVQLTAGFIRGQYSFDELRDIWPKKAQNMGFYEYLSVWLWDYDMPPGGRGANLKYLQQRIHQYVEARGTSLDCESGNNWGIHGLGYYVANKLMWNPKADVHHLVSDFYQQAFGPAAKVMRRYYERLDPGQDPLICEPLFGAALRDLEEAGQFAKDRPDVQARLDHLKQYWHYVRLKWDFDRADKDKKRDLALQTLTHSYRIRFSYMQHFTPVKNAWSAKLAKDFDLPNWDGRKLTAATPWKNDTPLSHEETERLFQEDLERFPTQQILERKFSDDLVPSVLRSLKAPADSNQRYQSPGRYALFSQKGEPLEFIITTGIIAWYRDRPQARLILKDSSGKDIHNERLPLDGLEHPFKIAVPKPGLYWLEFNDSGAAWGIKAKGGQLVSLAISRKLHPTHLGQMQRMYFFVPRGTKEIQYFWEGPPHDVLGPDGKVAAKVNERGKFVTIPVPPGSDGQAWSFNRLALRRLWFTNVPNYLAASPEALLMPKELVVVRDR